MNVCLLLAITWIWWAAIVGPTAWVCPSSLPVTKDRHENLYYDKVEFHITNCTKETYSAFIESLRTHLSSKISEYDIPLMRAQDASSSQELILVEIFGWDDEPITLVVNLVNAYVIAYQAQNRSYLLNGTLDNPTLYGKNPHKLSFSGSYPDLEHVAGEGRSNIELGITPLGSTILVLYGWTPPAAEKSVARSLIVLIQMVSEAARFRTIEQQVRRNIKRVGEYSTFRPGAGMLSLETNWASLSKRVQESNQGVFGTPVTLQTTDYKTKEIGNAETARKICGLALLLYACKARQSLQALASPHDSLVLSTLLVRSMLDIVDDDTCELPQTTVRISGRNGYCMDVKGGYYNNGNPIILSSCKDNADVNQLWTFKRDGTIQSNGKCLTAADGSSAGVSVVIYSCSSAKTGTTLWTMNNGSLINRPSGLVIGAESGNIGTTLTMQVDLNASKQGWLASNDTRPFLKPIIGLNGLCIQRNDQESVGLSTCDGNNSEQKWYLYSDGSIRPSKDTNYCVTCQAHDKGSRIVLLSCNFGGANQRWMFTSQGTIYNLQNGFVMDVKDSKPSLQQIIISSSTGNPNQMWFTTF